MREKRQVYLDNNATTKIDERVLEPMIEIMRGSYGNPSSVYQVGQKSKRVIEEARELMCGLLGIKTRELVFTSGGTEANNFAIRGITQAMINKGKHIITSNIEHSSVKNTLKDLEDKGWEVTYLKVDSKGVVDIEELREAIRPETVLITIMHSNNEIGTLQPVEAIGEIAKEREIPFHVDAVQSMGKVRIDLANIDTLTLASHKFYGPKGVGALYVKSGTKLDKLITGGQQERNRRGGTENVAGIFGMAKALEIALGNMYEEMAKERELRDYMEREVESRIEGVHFNGAEVERLANTSSITIKGVEAESLLLSLDMRGIAVSAGSACASSTLTPSHVLEAIGLTKPQAKGTIRVSLGRYTSREDIDYFIEVLEDVVRIEREMSIL
ncbi:cysteine desulfurase IscS [Propionigenium maris DSM 9537]|uniref:Cysteine desulfurase IscS n=1 Tax=Propionigenium maris DSM 9537 TaxID=1123000 RepID=A0A9W6LQ56_9FUSO|nr:cysteine desulfurase family protein [Propionigenium maris]GLI58010.1 cysteine desulfurase IscS [Propionigenium maris DSM 9537]